MMNTARFRTILEMLSDRLYVDLEAVTEKTRQGSGGQSTGELTNVPQHLGDMGTDELMHDLSATLLENQEYLAGEVQAARRRLDEGVFGLCEHCKASIPEQRLKAIPYARYCVKCAEKLDVAPSANLNSGRPENPSQTLSGDLPGPESTIEDDLLLSGVRRRSPPPGNAEVGTAGGGTAVGGLAGSNSGHGHPDEESLDRATSSSHFDVQESRKEVRIVKRPPAKG